MPRLLPIADAAADAAAAIILPLILCLPRYAAITPLFTIRRLCYATAIAL